MDRTLDAVAFHLDEGSGNETQQYCWWFSHMLDRLMYLHNYDPFAVYKIDEKETERRRLKLSVYKLPGLRIEKTEQDARRRRWGNVVALWFIYFMVKSHYVFFVTLEQRLKLLKETAPKTQIDETKEQTDFLSKAADLPIYICGNLAWLISLTFVLLPHYYRRKPMDYTSVRFLINPRHEVRRIDYVITDKLQELLISLDAYKSRAMDRLDFAQYRSTWKLLDRNRQQLFECLRDRPALRPNLFKPASLAKTSKGVSQLIWSYVLACVVMMATFMVILNHRDNLILESLFYLSNLALVELLSVIEFTVVATFLSLSLYFHALLYSLTARNQYQLLTEIKEYLTECLYYIRHPNYGAKSCSCFLDEVLLKTLIKIRVACDEIERGTRCMTEILCALSSGLVTIIVTAHITKNIGSPASDRFKSRLIMFYWVAINLMAVFIAYIPARGFDIQRLLSSLIAEITASRQFKVQGKPGDFTTILWRKFLTFFGSSTHLFTVQISAIKVTYRQIIEINFYIVSLTYVLIHY